MICIEGMFANIPSYHNIIINNVIDFESVAYSTHVSNTHARACVIHRGLLNPASLVGGECIVGVGYRLHSTST